MFSMHTNGMPVLKSSATLRQRVQARKKKAKTAEQAGKAPAKTAKTITKRKITKEEKAKAVKGDRPTDLRESRTAGETAIEQQRKACEDRRSEMQRRATLLPIGRSKSTCSPNLQTPNGEKIDNANGETIGNANGEKNDQEAGIEENNKQFEGSRLKSNKTSRKRRTRRPATSSRMESNIRKRQMKTIFRKSRKSRRENKRRSRRPSSLTYSPPERSRSAVKLTL